MKFLVLFLLVGSAVALPQAFQKPVFIEDLPRPSGERIVQGTPAVNGQFPHHAYLLLILNNGVRAYCGGSLISTRWVLTAAHCLPGMVQSDVHLGNVLHALSPVVVSTTNLIMHPNFNPSNLNHDIALIGLPNDVAVSDNIRPIPFHRDPSVTFAGSDATASGFGFTSNSGPGTSFLNFVGVRVITNQVCQETFGSSMVIPSTLCTVGRDNSAQGVCFGDSGGPLVIDINGVTTQIGVICFVSEAGCYPGFTNGFYRTSHYVSWINSHTGL